MSFSIEKLADKLNEAFANPRGADGLISEINLQVRYAAAIEASKGTGFGLLTPEQISTREELDPQDTLARLYWSIVASMITQVMMRAAAKQSHWQ